MHNQFLSAVQCIKLLPSQIAVGEYAIDLIILCFPDRFPQPLIRTGPSQQSIRSRRLPHIPVVVLVFFDHTALLNQFPAILYTIKDDVVPVTLLGVVSIFSFQNHLLRWFVCYTLYFLAVLYLFVSNLSASVTSTETAVSSIFLCPHPLMAYNKNINKAISDNFLNVSPPFFIYSNASKRKYVPACSSTAFGS